MHKWKIQYVAAAESQKCSNHQAWSRPLTGVQPVLDLLFLLTDLLYGSAQVYSLEFGRMLGNFSVNLFEVHLEKEKQQSEESCENFRHFYCFGAIF